MQLSKVFKGMLIALPVVTLMACSSTNDDQISAEEANRAAAAQAEQDRMAREQAEQAAQAEAMKAREVAEQQRQQAMDALQNNQVVYFEFDRSNIRSDATAVLDAHADFLIKNPSQSVVIEGHCDSRGTPEYNIALGERRAKAVATYLQNAGVSTSQISVVSYGEEKPAVMGSTEAAFAKNRRGVLVYQ
ncbi:peptidoglycan-associated lipoprotein Pal [Aestuariibacter halophilus]|uniref:Peptidoglycan-associated lipoprotein n=1 Tax=Fluctibacter halophilus TaxID=226011 RepID=A0ABS8G6H9_9ALTE|nr:peptidoglycan-associated lipoprotein Pal [Aestuariibacter halophilus]MCC2616099.1 peptidoglycan-associated lipoprotein Pal [Aestuariibacter halophilus]